MINGIAKIVCEDFKTKYRLEVLIAASPSFLNSILVFEVSKRGRVELELKAWGEIKSTDNLVRPVNAIDRTPPSRLSHSALPLI
jgi:hypothetical protein